MSATGDASALAAWLRLSLTPGLGNEGARKLLAAFGLPEAVFEASLAALQQVVSAKVADAVRQLPPQFAEKWAQTQVWLNGAEPASATRTVPRCIVTLGDSAYPADLLHMEDPPLLLYVMGTGDVAQLLASHCIAVVGSRNPTPQGEENARGFAKALVSAGLTVVSGLALGVDGAAHEGALEAVLCAEKKAQKNVEKNIESAHPQATTLIATVAVVGTGLDRVYPKQHFDLAHRIAARGLLVSEYPLGTPPLSANFPRRNRLIAGLSKATLVVEAALKSGSLITARLASEQGKDVFAIPGSIHAAQSRGCHALIKQGAKLVESAQDVLEEFGHWRPAKSKNATNKIASDAHPSSTNASFDREDAPESSLLQALGFDPVGLDALQARTGLPTAMLQAELLTLELEGHLARLPGGLFQRMGAA